MSTVRRASRKAIYGLIELQFAVGLASTLVGYAGILDTRGSSPATSYLGVVRDTQASRARGPEPEHVITGVNQLVGLWKSISANDRSTETDVRSSA